MTRLLRPLWQALTSIRLTIACLATAMILIFLGTIDQVNLGIWDAQQRYFRSIFVSQSIGGVTIPFLPGGYLVMGLLLVNLVAALVSRLRLSWGRSGILLIHAGLVLLLGGMFLSDSLSRESFMRLDEGQTAGFSESQRDYELAVLEPLATGRQRVTAIPDDLLAPSAMFAPGDLPFTIEVVSYFENAAVRAANPANPAITGLGSRLSVRPLPRAVQPGRTNVPAALVRLHAGGRPLGEWLFSGQIAKAEPVTVGGRTVHLILRPERYLHPFDLRLVDFEHETYAGSEIPRRFASHIEVAGDEAAAPRPVTISMNRPLRQDGLTLYQASFANNDLTSVLLVVRNPGWPIPYIACGFMILGMIIQFSIRLPSVVRMPAAQ